MKVAIEDFGGFLDTVSKPISSFLKSAMTNDPILKLSIGDKNKVICSTNDRMVELLFPGNTKQKGEAFIFASALTEIKTSHKNALIAKSDDNRVLITSKDGRRNLSLAIDCVNGDSFFDFKNLKSTRTAIQKLKLSELNTVLSKLRIVPVVIAGERAALHFSTVSKKGNNELTAIVHDSSRVLRFKDPKSPIKFDEDFTVDFKDIHNTISILSSVSDKAAIAFNKKIFMASGYNGNNERKINMVVNHLISDTTKIDKAKGILNVVAKNKPIMGFLINSDFSEVLENVINLAKLRSGVGHIDLELKNSKLIVSGSGPSSVYREDLKVKGSGSGTVRVGSNMLTDVIKLIPKNSMIKVTKNMVIILSNDKGKETLMLLPFINLSK